MINAYSSDLDPMKYCTFECIICIKKPVILLDAEEWNTF